MESLRDSLEFGASSMGESREELSSSANRVRRGLSRSSELSLLSFALNPSSLSLGTARFGGPNPRPKRLTRIVDKLALVFVERVTPGVESP